MADFDEIAFDLRCQMLAIEQSVASLWANYLANTVTEPYAVAKRLGQEAAGSIVEERAVAAAHMQPALDQVLKHTNALWKSVEGLLEQRG